MSSNLTELAMQEATLKALLDLVKDRYNAVRDDYQTAVETAEQATGGTIGNVIPKLSDGTQVATIFSRGSGDPVAEIEDPKAFLAWAIDNAKTEIQREIVTTVRPAYVEKILDQMTAAGAPVIADVDGVVTTVPGVTVRPRRSKTHSIRFKTGGRDAIVQAWRDGALQIPGIERPEIPS
jgi:hypothetical protein